MSTRVSKSFVFTYNNYTEEDEIAIQAIDCRYMIYGREVAPETGTAHLQGYCSFDKSIRLGAFTKKFPLHDGTIQVRTDIAKASAASNEVYCSKGSDVFTKGTPPLDAKGKGKRTADVFEQAAIAAKEGRLDDIPWSLRTKYYDTYKKIRLDYCPPPLPLDELPGIWYFGAPGVGKSKRARSEYPDAYIKDPINKWWDGYTNQDAVIIDDFDKYHIGNTSNIKRWVDHYPFNAEVKGSTIMIRPKKIVVTSNYLPEQIWKDDEVTLAAIKRRFVVIDMDAEYTDKAVMYGGFNGNFN